MVKKISNNFNKENCIYFSWAIVDSCCGRQLEAGRCDLATKEVGDFRMCTTKAPYCKFESIRLEETDVHSTQLRDPDGNSRNGDGN